jgi:apolipoprotein D and lipocalin family protein
MTSVVGLDLDTRIEQVEQRLVAREAWLRSTAESLGQRTRIALTPSPWVLPAVGAGVVLWLGWRWWYRREPVPRVSVNVPATVAGRHDDALADLPWAGLAAMGWPLMPAAWRGRVSPAAAAAVVSTVLSIGRRLFGRRRRLR